MRTARILTSCLSEGDSVENFLLGLILEEVESHLGIIRVVDQTDTGSAEAHRQALYYLLGNPNHHVINLVHTARDVQHKDHVHLTTTTCKISHVAYNYKNP